MTTPSPAAHSGLGDSIPVRIWSTKRKRNEIAVHFRVDDLRSCGLEYGDRLTLEIDGAVVCGILSADKKGPWLGTKRLADWSYRRITDALQAAGVDSPSERVALIVERNGLVLPATDPRELQRRAGALAKAGVAPVSPPGNPTPSTVVRTVTEFVRDVAVIAEVLRLSGGRCDLCGCDAPFLRADGRPYLEVHHVQTLADRGADTVDNAVALCPTCHRLLHHAGSQDREAGLTKLRARVARVSAAPA
jgi:hypothetical protein